MYFPIIFSTTALLLTAASHVHASVQGQGVGRMSTPERLVFRSQIHDTNLRYVANSGICETTPGVNQYSGYIDVGTNMSMWFWFFEARNSPETAPFTLWLNGSPGCSSMMGVFRENGPCRVKPDGNSTYLNPYSWNNVSNMIYIDQPIGAGFSYGTDTVNSTQAAAPFVWKAFQVLFESQVFSKYASREFIFATSSYGGRYGPSFVTYFDEKNTLIAKGAIQGERIVISALMISNGFFDSMLQNIAFYKFARNAPGYGQLQSDVVLNEIWQGLYGPYGCVSRQHDCYDPGNSTKSDDVCTRADEYCSQNVTIPALGNRDPYDLLQSYPASYPPEYYVNYLRNPEVVSRIGAESTYGDCLITAEPFLSTDNQAMTSLPELSALVNSGLRTLIWAGDRDILYNWPGIYDSVLAMNWYGGVALQNTPLTNITLEGETIAAVANVDNFTFARVYAAGHAVPAFQPAAALAIFTQVINKEPLHCA